MKIALVGNQNSGKTSLFNLLTGTNQKVGNWPGVTIERKVGKIKGTNYDLVDLPGIYSLTPYTAEEDISRKYVMEENPDLIINIIDATSIERSLYLTTQLLELDANIIVALNMSDMLEKKGIHIDIDKLSKVLNITIVSISALKRTGVDELINRIKENNVIRNSHLKIFPPLIEKNISEVSQFLDCPNKRFVAVKVIEEDVSFKKYFNDEIKKMHLTLEQYYGYDTEQIIANERYNFVEKVRNETTIFNNSNETTTDKLDHVFLNKYLAIPIFIVIMALVYFLAVSPYVGGALVDVVGNLIDMFSGWIEGLLISIKASSWMISLICNGIIAGVGAVLGFVPQLIILFLCISILETTGYMSRIAFFLDKLFRRFGLSGKALIPFIVGSGCSVPGIMAARTVEDETERRMTIMLTPFVPCSAKLPIIILFASSFFQSNVALLTVGVYFMAIILILLSAIVLKKLFKSNNKTSFISELPEYKLPSARYVGRDVYEKTIAFIKRAGSIILICSVAVWLLLSFTWSFQYTDADWQEYDNNSVESYAEQAGYSDFEYEDGNAQTKYVNDKINIRFLIDDEWTKWYNFNSDIMNEIPIDEIDSKKEISLHVNEGLVEYKYSYGVDNSILASIGKTFSFIFYPILGEMNWGATVSAFQGLVAKEQVVSSMAVIAGLSDDVEDADAIFSSEIFASITPLAGFSFLIFNLFSAPCFGAIGAMSRELGSKKKLAIAVGFQTGLAWAMGCLIFGIGSLIGLVF